MASLRNEARAWRPEIKFAGYLSSKEIHCQAEGAEPWRSRLLEYGASAGFRERCAKSWSGLRPGTIARPAASPA